jgi:hypothetical protein
MVAGVRRPAHIAIDTGMFEACGGFGAEQQVIEAQPGIARPTVPHVISESVHGLIGMKSPDRIHPP